MLEREGSFSMEENVIRHFCHDHPLILTENVGINKEILCYGCRNLVISEWAYVCTQKYCPTKITLHKRCAELPRQISHASHPMHTLNLRDYRKGQFWRWVCCLCDVEVGDVLGYECYDCNFGFDISCPQVGRIDDISEKKRLQHPSHYHPLTLMRRPAPFLFNCDACGTDDSDMAYICSICEFWIHKTCATLPQTIETNRHHHKLSLAFNLPVEYHKYDYICGVCLKGLNMICWVYNCGVCRYFIHVKCAMRIETNSDIIPAKSSSDLNCDLIQLPVNDFSKELITPFIIRARENDGLDKIPDTKDMPASIIMPETTASFSLLFNYHKHPLSLVSEGPKADEKLLMICDVCVTPIYTPPYYHCPMCNNYFVHSTCYLLPKTLSLYGKCPQTHENHKFTLYTGPELDNSKPAKCGICLLETSGRVYGCEDCELIIDLKCAALPTTLKHTSHQQHTLTIRRVQKEDERRYCIACGFPFKRDVNPMACYCTSNGCTFALHIKCVMLPQSIKHEWDRHPLMLTYDASLDHPSDFYCEVCEKEIYPKEWMYCCRECDRSFHTFCDRENVKFGRQVEFDHRLHPHPLTMTSVTLKLRCDACRNKCYKLRGFQCADCNYVLCYDCGLANLDKM